MEGKADTRVVGSRQIKVAFRQLENGIKHINDFQYQYTMFIGGLLRTNQSECIELYDQYIDRLLTAAIATVRIELDQAKAIEQEFVEQGYSFSANGTEATVTVELTRSCVSDLIELYVLLNELLTVYNRLEKTPYLRTPQFFQLQNEWVRLPKTLVSRLIGLANRMKDKTRFVARTANKASVEAIDTQLLSKLMLEYQTSTIHLFAKDKTPMTLSRVNAESESELQKEDVGSESFIPPAKQVNEVTDTNDGWL